MPYSMKAMFASIAAAAMLLLSACGQDRGGGGDVPEGLENQSLKAERASVDDRQGPVLATDLFIRETSPTLDFAWHAPPEIAGAPGALSSMRAEADTTRAEMQKEAREFSQMLAEEGQDPRQLSYRQDWTLGYETPGLMNFTSETYRYDGGAHGMTTFDSLFWDKEAGAAVDRSALFVNWPQARERIASLFCENLDRMRADRRGGEVGDGGLGFSDCPDVTDFPWALSNGGIGEPALKVLVEPYAAGPYAEGSYEVTIPLSNGLRGAMKTVYVPAG